MGLFFAALADLQAELSLDFEPNERRFDQTVDRFLSVCRESIPIASLSRFEHEIRRLRDVADTLLHQGLRLNRVDAIDQVLHAYQSLYWQTVFSDPVPSAQSPFEPLAMRLDQRRKGQAAGMTDAKILQLERDILGELNQIEIERSGGIQPKRDQPFNGIATFCIGQHIYALDYRVDPPECHLLPMHKLELTQTRLKLNHFLATGARRSSELITQALLKDLYTGLLAPLDQAARLSGSVEITADPVLADVPFGALFDGERYLCQRVAIMMRPIVTRPRSDDSPKLESSHRLIIAYDETGRLPHIESEGRYVAQTTPEATCRAFFELVPTADWIHVTSHVRLRNRSPWFSSIALEDGQLCVLDVVQRRLKASMVNLSACQTGRMMFGESINEVGFVNAFLAAGAQSVVSSLWRIEDRSAESIMISFYDRLRAGDRLEVAVQAAQIEMIEAGGGTAHPYHWAPYQTMIK